MPQEFNKGDKVEWNAGQGKTIGTVKEKITKSQEVEGNQVAASEDDPRYLIENDHTGNLTTHKPNTLEKVSDSDQKESSSEEREQRIKEFQEAVNMTPKELEKWLATDESQSVGQKEDDNESIGHKSGRRIVENLGKNKSDYTQDDIEHMKRVISYVHRHLAQKPSGDIEHSRWRYSLMNWGHDPLK